MDTPDACAREMLEVVPMVMRIIRNRMRSHRTPGLSVPQLRAMIFLSRNRGASLSDVAEYVGLTRPSASKLIEVLVARGLVSREGCMVDRRRIRLGVTNEGKVTLEAAWAAVQSDLAQRMAAVPAGELAVVGQAMRILRFLFEACVEAKIGEESAGAP